MQTAQGLSPERNLWTSCQLIECSLKSKMVYPEPLVQHKRHLCKNILHVFERYFFFSGPGGSSHCVISDKVNVFWILISPETLLSSVIRFLGLKKKLNHFKSDSKFRTCSYKKEKKTSEKVEKIHFGFTLAVELHFSAGVKLILPRIKAQRTGCG